MKNSNLPFFVTAALVLALLMSSCKKNDTVKPANPTNTNTGLHIVDQRLVGSWLWTQGSDQAHYDNNGTYNGSAYGFACQLNIKPDGTGTCFNHVYSTLDGNTGLEVNVYYVGFYESDDKGHIGFFPTGGTYTSNGVKRDLRADELWDVKTNTGNRFLYQKLVITTQGNRKCIQVTSSDDITDTYFAVN